MEALAVTSDELTLWLFCGACWLYAIFQDRYALYWRKKYERLRDCPVIREVRRQLLTEDDIVSEQETSPPTCKHCGSTLRRP